MSKIDGLISSQNTLNRVLVYGILYAIKSARWKSAVLMVQKAISIVQQIGKVLVRLGDISDVLRNSEQENWFLNIVNDTYAEDTFMSSEAVIGQLNLIGIKWHPSG